MAARRPSFVLFDLGNVLVHIAPTEFLKRLRLDAPDLLHLYQAPINEIVRQYESGNESTDVFLSRLESLFNGQQPGTASTTHGRTISRDEIQLAMLAVIGTPVHGMLEFVTRLSSSVPLGLLSNTNPLHFDLCKEHLPVLQLIPFHFLSYQIRSLKPESRIFTQVVERLQIAPSDIFYIDDIPLNVEAGKRAGMNSHLFHGRDELEKALGAMGLA